MGAPSRPVVTVFSMVRHKSWIAIALAFALATDSLGLWAQACACTSQARPQDSCCQRQAGLQYPASGSMPSRLDRLVSWQDGAFIPSLTASVSARSCCAVRLGATAASTGPLPRHSAGAGNWERSSGCCCVHGVPVAQVSREPILAGKNSPVGLIVPALVATNVLMHGGRCRIGCSVQGLLERGVSLQALFCVWRK